MLLDKFFQKFIEDFVMRTWMQVCDDTFLLLRQSLISLQKEIGTRVLGDVLVRFVSVVVTCLSDQKCFKLLFVNLFRLITDFDQHLNDFLKVDAFDCLAIPLFLDVT